MITELALRNSKPRSTDYSLRDPHGFVVRIRPSGSKTYYYIYRFNGVQKRLTLGTYPAVTLAEAREQHLESMLKLKRGEDPGVMPELIITDPDTPATLTCSRLIDLYLDWSESNHAKKWHNTQQLALKKDFIGDYGNKLAADLKRRDAISLAESLSARPGAARNLLKALRSAWKYGMERELIETNPFADANLSRAVPAVAPQQRKRILTDDEIKYLWSAIAGGGGSDSTKRALKLILVTGQRPGEVAGMSWSEIQYGEGRPFCNDCRCCGWWTIPVDRRKTRKKAGTEDHRVYLSPFAMSLIHQSTHNIYICPSDGLEAGSVAVNSVNHHVRRIVAGTGKQAYYGLQQWQPHDLRRTAATGIARLGALPAIVEQVLGHSLQGVAGTYNLHQYDQEKQGWLMRWSEYLSALVE